MLASRRNERLESKKAAGASPRPTVLPFIRCTPVEVCFLLADQTTNPTAHPWHSIFRKHLFQPPLVTYFPSADQTAPLIHTLRWQPISIPAQGSPYTTKTVGGEAVRRFFSLKYAVLLYTLSTLFRELSLRKQNTSGKFLRSFFQKATSRPRIPRVPASPRILRERLRR